MEIISLINKITNTFNVTFSKNLNPLNLESKIKNIGDEFIENINVDENKNVTIEFKYQDEYNQLLNYINDKRI